MDTSGLPPHRHHDHPSNPDFKPLPSFGERSMGGPVDKSDACPSLRCRHDAAAHDDDGRCHEYIIHYFSASPDAAPIRSACRCGWDTQLDGGGRL